MVGNESHIGRKEGLVSIVNLNRDIGPPQKGLRQRRAVVQPHLGFDNRFARRKADAHHAFHAQHGIVLAEPHRPTAILVLLNALHGQAYTWRAVVLRPVELNSAGDPWAQQPHQRRLDHVLAVEEVVLVGLVQSSVDAPANLRQNHQLDKFVLKQDRPIAAGPPSPEPRGR